ncbi:hypothetical protein MBLNU230_g7244t1 [Neophaeotheca triangularis]
MSTAEYQSLKDREARNNTYSDAAESDLGSTDDDDHDTANDPKSSADLRRHDQETLATEEDAERLLAGDEKGSSGVFGEHGASKRQRKSFRRKKRRGGGGSGGGGGGGEEKELMYDMEAAGGRSSGESSGNSSEVDMRRMGETMARQKGSMVYKVALTVVSIAIAILAFVSFLYGSYKATESLRSNKPPLARAISNGTSLFAPTTLMISLDGFRADFLTRNITPTLSGFVAEGVSPKYMLPSFPSLTFPNHFTLVTGLYPESHGVVGNTFWDPVMGKEFWYTDPSRSMQPEWWLGEPVWETAELAGIRSAIHMWPGSEAHIGSVEPTYVDKFNGKEALGKKVDRILELLDLPGPHDEDVSDDSPRPQFIAAYVPNVDAEGHKYGPNSTEVNGTIKDVDSMLGSIFRGIDERNLTDIVNIVVVSDHGMATTSTHRLIQLEDLLDTSLIEHTDGWPLYGLRPYNQTDAHLQDLYNQLLAKTKLPEYAGNLDVYLRDTNMPAKYHFSQNQRIAPLWLVPRAGWAIVHKAEFDVQAALAKDPPTPYVPRGLHGYDHEDPLMRAIFVARGPAFPHPAGSIVAPFQNIEVYNVVCDSLGIEPTKGNGTLRLPFQVDGVHGDLTESLEKVHDHPALESQSANPFIAPVPVPSNMPPVVGSASGEAFSRTASAAKSEGTVEGVVEQPARPEVHDGLEDDKEDDKMSAWWDWVTGKVEDAKGWVSGLFKGEKEGKGEEKGG